MDQGTTTDTTSTGKQQIEITPVSSTGESGKKPKQQPSSTQKLTADGRAALPLQYA